MIFFEIREHQVEKYFHLIFVPKGLMLTSVHSGIVLILPLFFCCVITIMYLLVLEHGQVNHSYTTWEVVGTCCSYIVNKQQKSVLYRG